MTQDPGGSTPAWGSAAPGSGWGTPPPAPPAAPATSQFTPAPAGPGFGGGVLPGTPSDGGSPVSAPMQWLGLAALLEVIGTVLGGLSSDKPALSVAGWVLGGFGAMGTLAFFTLADSRRRTDPWYSSTALPNTLRGVLALASVVVVALNAWQFADWASRR